MSLKSSLTQTPQSVPKALMSDIDDKELDEVTRTVNYHEAVRKAVDLYIGDIEYHDRNEEQSVDV
jgi:hypothetical protein